MWLRSRKWWRSAHHKIGLAILKFKMEEVKVMCTAFFRITRLKTMWLRRRFCIDVNTRSTSLAISLRHQENVDIANRWLRNLNWPRKLKRQQEVCGLRWRLSGLRWKVKKTMSISMTWKQSPKERELPPQWNERELRRKMCLITISRQFNKGSGHRPFFALQSVAVMSSPMDPKAGI